ncbi:MAG: acylphosphatase [Sulfolobales archaeon]
MEKALRIKIIGVVQGVGYRPFVYRLATKLSLRGYVVNRGGAEVEIFVEGEENKLVEFRERLLRDKPPSTLRGDPSRRDQTPRLH